MIELSRVETDEHVETVLALRRAIDPEHAVGRTAYRQHLVAPGRSDWLAWLAGRPVGCAFVEPFRGNLEGRDAYVSVRVLAELRRRGVGTELFRRVSASARAAGHETLYFVARHDDADSLAYLSGRGFVEVLRMQELSLDLERASEPSESPNGIVVVPLRPEHEPAVYEAAVEIYRDVPEEDGIWIGSFDDWRRADLPEHLLRGCSLVALVDDEVVGYATLVDAGDGVGLHDMTGTRRVARGRGVATALKRAQIAAARAAGLSELRTTTAAANAPMLRVNEKLGYRRGVSWIHLRGPLLDGGPR